MSDINSNLSGRVAVVAGASSGIGRETAKLLARQGARVALLARRKDKLDEIVQEIAAGGGLALAIETDMTSADAVTAAAGTIHNLWGRADLVFNNAGVMLPGAIEDHNLSEWQHQIDLNVSGVMNVINAFIPHLSEAAAENATVDLINTSSIAGQYLYPYFAVYSATKAYVSHLTRHLRLELGPKNIRISVIEPGIVATELQSHVTFQGAKDWLAGAEKQIDFLQPEDVAEVVAFLASQPRHVNLQQVVIMPTRQAV
ncbi:SDR family oxidoreductase [Klebsiella quasipneumoniae]|uniref:SDR family oxidoreductase n=1 Tax=Klebsiella quasipneumoniae TaxID=1463165 RepID=UPI00244A63FB|nr:SDR family oxidoreductase [Klebsiella quasipneumoniae]MDH2672390.1 SDR family oxidoreductase [Klebsiella quasipneumoniae]